MISTLITMTMKNWKVWLESSKIYSIESIDELWPGQHISPFILTTIKFTFSLNAHSAIHGVNGKKKDLTNTANKNPFATTFGFLLSIDHTRLCAHIWNHKKRRNEIGLSDNLLVEQFSLFASFFLA